MTDPASGSRYPELRDPDWWRVHGGKSDTDIAKLVGCSRETARLARRAAGTAPLPRGRRRGTMTLVAQLVETRTAEELIGERIREQHARRTEPANWELIDSRVDALRGALAACEWHAMRDALIELAAGCGLMIDHLQQLEAA